jgi:ssDNA-binding Zn-finger/Zn-ribbon topoisomerase 1
MENTTKSYGYEHPTECPNCGQDSELVASKASDVNFGDISSDIVMIYCPKCRYEEAVFSY